MINVPVTLLAFGCFVTFELYFSADNVVRDDFRILLTLECTDWEGSAVCVNTNGMRGRLSRDLQDDDCAAVHYAS